MSTESNRILLKHHLEKLRLPTVRREWESVAAACAGEGVVYGDFLLRLTERELIEREQRAAQKRVKSAKFPVLKTLDAFDFGAQPSIKEALVRELATGEYLEARENVLLIGNSGTGKSHLAVALGFAACAQGKRVRFWSATALVTQMLEMREQRDLKRFFSQVEKNDLLILDELGYVPFSKAGAELLFEIVSRAYERLSLILTTQPALRAMDRGDGQRTAHRGDARPSHPPGPHPRSQRRELSPPGRPQAAPEIQRIQGGLNAPLSRDASSPYGLLTVPREGIPRNNRLDSISLPDQTNPEAYRNEPDPCTGIGAAFTEPAVDQVPATTTLRRYLA